MSSGLLQVFVVKTFRRSLVIFIIKGFRTIVFIFIVISTTFRPICPLAFFKCLSKWGTFTELCTTSFIEASKETIIWRLQVQSWLEVSNNTGVLNTCTRLWLTESEQAIPVDSIKDVVRNSVKVPELDKHLKKAGGHIGRCRNNNKDEDNGPKKFFFINIKIFFDRITKEKIGRNYSEKQNICSE